jgi:hypothetical protein
MAVRAKMYVTKTEQGIHGGAVELQVVCRGEDNKKWAAATPTGNARFGILNQLALDEFQPGVEYFVTFERVPEDLSGKEGMNE